ncbi:hypothetical protein GRI89_01600 [Altererythrobacter salegens]|uniref:Uncharacterized protein n=1 Tax=Croceibacterium salegens TaxID=1737568 RepID=A0A6I4SRQ5_9SPHN|nr:hypothetical protein [Croceibacterium salegens]MXO58239.1 hypothetical protein [Croceibacterium salegens]
MDIPAWIAFFMGLYSLVAAVGEFREPGTWAAMLEDFEHSAGLRFLTGLICIVLGASVYLVSPWRSEDWLSIVVNVIGGLCAAEGFLILAAGDRFLPVARKLLGRSTKGWAGFSALFGMAALLVALSRL